jgi:hypothetical protein
VYEGQHPPAVCRKRDELRELSIAFRPIRRPRILILCGSRLPLAVNYTTKSPGTVLAITKSGIRLPRSMLPLPTSDVRVKGWIELGYKMAGNLFKLENRTGIVDSDIEDHSARVEHRMNSEN